MAKHKIHVTFPAGGCTRRGLRYMAEAAAAVLRAQKVNVPCLVWITVTDDAGIHEINRRMRNVDRPTDVLSFPMWELRPGAFSAADCSPDADTGRVNLGDMVISWPRAKAQGREYGHSAEREAAYLAVHSVLHLLGYDHLDEGEEKRAMRAREKEIMALLGHAQ